MAAVAIVAAGLLGLAGTTSAMGVHSPHGESGQVQPHQADDRESPCVLKPGKWADPVDLWLGETTTVTLTSTTKCPAKLIPLHVVLSMDSSLSMGNGKIDDAQDAARRFIDRMDFDVSKVGVTSFDGVARIDTELTDSRGRAVSAIMGLQLALGTDIAGGISKSRDVLVRGRTRNRDEGAPAPIEVIIILSDGVPWPGGPAGVISAAGQAKGQGILIVAVCVGADCDTGLMRSVASRPNLFFDVRDSRRLFGVYNELANQLLNTNLRRLVINDALADNMRYVPNSADPPVSDEGDGWLEWTWTVLPASGVTVTYRLEPLEEGEWPTSRLAVGNFRDTDDRIGSMTFPTPTVRVRIPTATPTPVHSPTPTRTATPTPTATPEASATPTRRPPPEPVFLPIILNEHCDPEVVPTDVVLLIDISTSMSGPTRRDGISKREGARRAARAFVEALGPGGRAGIILFSSQSRILVPLGEDSDAALRALEFLPTDPGTDIAGALRDGRQVLMDSGQPVSTKAVLLLTDGQPTISSEQDARDQARVTRQAGIHIYAVGLGGDVNPELLRDIAGDPNRFVHSPGVEDLIAIYRSLVRVIPCPGGRHDWTAPWP